QYKAKLLAQSLPSPNGQCTFWGGGVRKDGYGRLSVKWPGSSKFSNTCAHRVSYLVAYPEKIGLDGDISHLCHNRCCINPDHLTLEPHTINNTRLICVNM
ncbi:unnamed protein product, partial [Owenia fusiformis]